MKESDKRFVTYWVNKREQGAVKFSIVTGTTYAIMVVVFSKIFAWNWTFTQKDLSYAVVSEIIGVMALGPLMWWLRERKYHKLVSQSKPSGNKKKKSKK